MNLVDVARQKRALAAYPSLLLLMCLQREFFPLEIELPILQTIVLGEVLMSSSLMISCSLLHKGFNRLYVIFAS